MHALEPEPEQSGRWRRLLGGAAVTSVTLGLLAFGATRYEPSRRLIEKVVQMTVVETKEKPKPEPQQKKFEPPPPPKRKPPPQKAAVKTETPPQQAPAADVPPQVGLDSSSFSGEGNGLSFQQGDSAMGDPTLKGRAGKKVVDVPAVFKKPAGAPKIIAAKVVRQSKLPSYTQRARELGLQGVVVVEVAVDATGRVTGAKVRSGLDPDLDRQALASVREWLFEPGTRDGRKIASTRFVRVRFRLAG